jgi:hypothetical protein
MDLKAWQREGEGREVDVRFNSGFIFARLFPYGMLDEGGRDTAFKIM